MDRKDNGYIRTIKERREEKKKETKGQGKEK